MLAFRRKANEKIYLNDDIVIEILGITESGTVRIGIDAPEDVVISRGEHRESAENENRRAAEADFDLSELIALLEKKKKRQTFAPSP